MNKILIMAFLALICVTTVHAGSVESTVNRLFVRDDGLIYFETNSAATNKTGCGLSYPSAWVIKDENSNWGKQQLAIIMTALSTSKTIVVAGADTCGRISTHDVEDVSYIYLLDY